MKKKMYSEVARLKEFLEYLIKKYKPICPFCKKPINWQDIYPYKYGDSRSWTRHHTNLNHLDDRIENQELSHRDCHRKFHKKLDKKNMV